TLPRRERHAVDGLRRVRAGLGRTGGGEVAGIGADDPPAGVEEDLEVAARDRGNVGESRVRLLGSALQRQRTSPLDPEPCIAGPEAGDALEDLRDRLADLSIGEPGPVRRVVQASGQYGSLLVPVTRAVGVPDTHRAVVTGGCQLQPVGAEGDTGREAGVSLEA